MVFKRREKRSLLKRAADFIYPKGGWSRAFHYLRHRVRRLPDSPHRISRGIFAGVFTAFTPFYGAHFLLAALVARAVKGNVWAALAGTFFGNPLTYLPIGVVSLKVGHFILGSRPHGDVEASLIEKFTSAAHDLWRNFFALFTDADAHWENLSRFFDEVFLPYLVGGILPGIVAGLACYYFSLPVVSAYQKHRAARLRKKFLARRAAAAEGKPTKKP